MAVRREECDVVVVGGGFSGLAAALAIRTAHPQLTIRLLEARSRVGGRVENAFEQYSTPDGRTVDARVDVGGAYVGPTQDRLLKLARRMGVRTYKLYNSQGSHVMDLSPHSTDRREYSGTIPPLGILGLLDSNALLRETDRMAFDLDPDAAWDHPKAAEWDKMTVQDFFDQHCWDRGTKELCSLTVRTILCKEPKEVSLLYWLRYIRSGQGIIRLAEAENGAQERKFVEGSATICDRVADELGRGDTVLLDHPVSVIRRDEDRVVVTATPHGKPVQFVARRVIMAVPPNLYTPPPPPAEPTPLVTFDPPLPPAKANVFKAHTMGKIIKTVMFYDRAFWRDHGHSGMTLSHGDGGPIALTYDDSGPKCEHPAIMGFLLAGQHRQHADTTKEERKAAITAQYARLFGSDEALRPVHYVERDWTAEKFSGGCYVASTAPEALTRYGSALRRPVGAVHFAGTELASKWTGYMDGAIESGERAAAEVLTSLGLGDTVAPPPVEEDLECTARPNNDAIIQWLPTVPQTGGIVVAAIGLLVAWWTLPL